MTSSEIWYPLRQKDDEMKQFKPKYGLLKTTKLYVSWIRSNLSFFLQVVFAGALLGFLTGIVLSEAMSQMQKRLVRLQPF